VGFRNGDGERFVDELDVDYDGTAQDIPNGEVTHWQPEPALPAPPSGSKERKL